MRFEPGTPILRRVLATDQTGLSAATRYCAVYGHPVAHSASPALQNAGMAALDLDWRYLAFDVRPEHLQAALAGARAMNFIGLNLTLPHKLLAVPMVDELDDSARIWGAVNTISMEARIDRSEWKPLGQILPENSREVRARGFNTDADAIIRALQEDLACTVEDAHILLLGAGGAGRTAALRLAAAGAARLFLVNRTTSKADELAHEIQKRFPLVRVETGYPADQLDLVLNATSLGLRPDDPLPFDRKQFSFARCAAAFDMIYRPAETLFLQAARSSGCRTANGIGMLLYQGAKALEIWSGRPAPVTVMREALLQNVYGTTATHR